MRPDEDGDGEVRSEVTSRSCNTQILAKKGDPEALITQPQEKKHKLCAGRMFIKGKNIYRHKTNEEYKV